MNKQSFLSDKQSFLSDKQSFSSNKKDKKNTAKQKTKENQSSAFVERMLLPRRVVVQIAREVAKVVGKSLSRKSTKRKSKMKVENPIILDTSAIIDGRVFQLIRLGVFYGNFVLLEPVLSELKHLADSREEVKKERGRKALKMLDDIKKQGIKLIVVDEPIEKTVDDTIIDFAKRNKGRIVTCDYSLSQKAKIGNVVSIDIYEVANALKTIALPGEEFWVKLIQKGKSPGQGVGYLQDGTMIVVEEGENLLGKTVEVVVSRVIQTDAGKILFSKLQE